MAGFVPTSARELYQRMLEWKEMRDTIACNAEGDSLIWIVADDLRLEISIWRGEVSIYVFDSANRKNRL